MAVIVKVQAIWSGFQGAPGYTNWYGLSDGDSAAAAQALAGRMHTLFDVMRGMLPAVASVKVQRTYQVLNSINGFITSEGNLATDQAVVQGTGAAPYAGAGGAVITWNTGAYNELGHKLRGRTFLVPLTGAFDTGGTLSDPALSGIQAAATACIGGTGNLVVYSRPRDVPNKPPATGETHYDGEVNTVISATVKDKAGVLRSRRD